MSRIAAYDEVRKHLFKIETDRRQLELPAEEVVDAGPLYELVDRSIGCKSSTTQGRR
jgi:hypothetical protein